MTEPILAGYGSVDITPQRDDPPTFEIYDPIYFRCLHLRQGSRQATFVTADLFLLDDRFHDLLARELQDEGIDPDWILCGASHLGTGPTLFQHYVNQPTEALKQFGQDELYARAAAKAVRAALADASPARIAVGTGEAHGLSYNRRAHDESGALSMVSLTQYSQPPAHLRYDAVDPQVGVVRFDRDGKRPIALVNFGCHALSLWDQRGNISGDYPGRMAGLLGQSGIDALFFQGALGNVHPFRQTDDPCTHIARGLTDIVLSVFNSLEPSAEADLHFGAHAVEVERRPVSAVDEAQQAWEARPSTAEGLARYKYWLAQTYADKPTDSFNFHVVALGDTALLHMPGEPFVETAQAIRAASPYKRVMLLSNPCPEMGYLPTPEAHAEGGDEPMFAPLEDQAESVIRHGAIQALREVANA